MFVDSIKVGDIVRIKPDLAYPAPHQLGYGKVWRPMGGKTGIVVEMAHDEISDCERVILWIEGREAEFFLDEIEVIDES
jgi:hypothetical protein